MPGFGAYSSEAAQAPNGPISMRLKRMDVRYDVRIAELEKRSHCFSRNQPVLTSRWAVL